MNYPPDWFCRYCEKSLSDHVQIGTPDQEASESGIATINWCLKIDDPANKNYFFEPVDNLTYVEMKANEQISC